MREDLPGDRDTQFVGMRPIQLHRLPGLAHLRKVNLAGRPVRVGV